MIVTAGMCEHPSVPDFYKAGKSYVPNLGNLILETSTIVTGRDV